MLSSPPTAKFAIACFRAASAGAQARPAWLSGATKWPRYHIRDIAIGLDSARLRTRRLGLSDSLTPSDSDACARHASH
jgi:hypothetical protein